MPHAFYLKRKDLFLGKELKFGETSKNKFLRIAHKNTGFWKRPVHEVWEINKSFKKKNLSSPLLHYSALNIAQFLEKINYYTTLNAEHLNKQKVKSSFYQILLYPALKFLLNYIVKLGFLDGTHGFLHAAFMSFHSFLTRAKLYLLQKENS